LKLRRKLGPPHRHVNPPSQVGIVVGFT